ncbi:ATP-binding protein [Alkalibacillus almallahensis]|uniref:ATP-binding protein n=1 Tax=Alkalibacillus almallahensis TaxID=1379154 RepID=UPI003C7C876B
MDEIGYFSFDEWNANTLFQIISKRYEQGAMILTSNNHTSSRERYLVMIYWPQPC